MFLQLEGEFFGGRHSPQGFTSHLLPFPQTTLLFLWLLTRSFFKAISIRLFLKVWMCNATYLGLIIQNIKTTLNQVEWRKKGLADFSLPGILNVGSKERIQWPVNLDGNLFTNHYVKFSNFFNQDDRQQITVVLEIPVNLSIEIRGIFMLHYNYCKLVTI